MRVVSLPLTSSRGREPKLCYRPGIFTAGWAKLRRFDRGGKRRVQGFLHVLEGVQPYEYGVPTLGFLVSRIVFMAVY